MQQQNTAERVRSTERWEETLLKQVQQMQAALLKQKSEVSTMPPCAAVASRNALHGVDVVLVSVSTCLMQAYGVA